MDLSLHTSANTPSFGLAGQAFAARLVDVHDGDTLTVVAEVFPSHVFKVQVRLIGIDTPEMTSKNPLVKVQAECARLRVLALLTNETAAVPHPGHLTRSEMVGLLQRHLHLVHVRCRDMDKYGRVLAEVASDEHGTHVGTLLLQEGLARPYTGGTKDPFE